MIMIRCFRLDRKIERRENRQWDTRSLQRETRTNTYTKHVLARVFEKFTKTKKKVVVWEIVIVLDTY